MKKILCTLMAVLAIGCCFAGCVDHDDGKCDECEAKGAFQVEDQGDDELCGKCWIKKGVAEW